MTSKIESATFYPAFTQEFSGIELSNNKNSVETEQFHEYITYDLISEETSNLRRESLPWKFAGIIAGISMATLAATLTAISLTIFAIITAAFTGVFTTAYHLTYLPLILGIFILVVTPLIKKTHDYIFIAVFNTVISG